MAGVESRRGGPSKPKGLLIALLFGGTLALIGFAATTSAQGLGLDIPGFAEYVDPWLTFVPEKIRLTAFGAFGSIATILACSILIATLKSLKYEREAHDLLYYLGFIGTLVALVAASFTLVMKGDGKTDGAVSILIAQNGIALTSTIFGMVARNFFRYKFPPELSPLAEIRLAISDIEETSKRAASGIRQLQIPVRTATDQVGEFGVSIERLGSEAASTAQRIREGQTDWNAFSETASRMSGDLSQSATNLRALANALATMPNETAAVGGQVNRSIAGIGSYAAALRAELERISFLTSQLSRLPPQFQGQVAPPVGYRPSPQPTAPQRPPALGDDTDLNSTLAPQTRYRQ